MTRLFQKPDVRFKENSKKGETAAPSRDDDVNLTRLAKTLIFLEFDVFGRNKNATA